MLGKVVDGRYIIEHITTTPFDPDPHHPNPKPFRDVMPYRGYPNKQTHCVETKWGPKGNCIDGYCSICDAHNNGVYWSFKDVHGYCDYAPVRYQVPIKLIPRYSYKERIARGMRPNEDPRSYPMLFAIALLRRKGLLSI